MPEAGADPIAKRQGRKSALAVGVGVGVPHEVSMAVNTWPLVTGGLWPPVVSQPYCVKLVSVCLTPTTNWLSLAIAAGVIEP